MTRTRQVRLEPDVVDLLTHDRDLGRLSLSAATNEAIRWALSTIDQDEPGPPDAPIVPPGARRPPAVPVRDLAAGQSRRRSVRCPRCGSSRGSVGSRCLACGVEIL